MNEAEISGVKKKRSKKWAIVMMAVGVLLPFVVWFGWGMYWSGQIRGELEKIKDAGQPVSFAELAAGRPGLDVEDNAGPIYGEAMELLGDVEYEFPHVFFGLNTEDEKGQLIVPSDEELAAAKKVIDRHGDVLALIDEAGRLNVCEYDLGQTQGFEEPQDNYSRVRNVFRISSLRSQYLICTGQLEEAAKSIDSTLKIQRLLLRYPVLIGELVRVSLHLGAIADVRLLLNQDNISDDVLLDLSRSLVETSSYYDLKRVAMGERVFQIYWMNHAIISSVPEDMLPEGIRQFNGISPVDKRSAGKKELGRRIAASMLKDARRYVDVLDDSWHESMSRVGAIPADDSLSNIFSWDVNVHGFNSIASVKTVNDIAILVVHVELFRNMHNRIPESLDELGSQYSGVWNVDPFSGKSYRYQVDEDGYVVYTVGPNRVDDGGAIYRCESGNRELDWGIRVEK